MHCTLTISDTLAERLRTFAAAQGISIEEAGRYIFCVGLTQIESELTQSTIVYLGSLHSSLPSTKQIEEMCSPIVVCGPIPPLQLISILIS